MVLEHYITDLLYRYNCVIVPGFGAFLAERIPAQINETSNTFFAPTKSIAFNGQLTSNDGLLVSYIAETEKSSFDRTLEQIEVLVKEWKEKLENGDTLSLPHIGHLFSNHEGSIQFKPSQEVNYLTSSFGLASINAIPVTREVLKEEVVAMEEKIPFIISPERRETYSFRPYLKYAAILFLALSTGLTGYRFYQDGLLKNRVARQEAQEQVTKQIQEATFFDTAPMELPTVKIATVSMNTNTSLRGAGIHHIIAGAFRLKSNAERKIKSLKNQGYNAAYYGTNAYGLHMVTYDRHDNADDALRALRKIKRNHSSDAWLLSEK